MRRPVLIFILLISIALYSCKDEELIPAISAENLAGSWVYKSITGADLSPYTELQFDLPDEWQEKRIGVSGDTLRIGGGTWSLQDSVLKIRFIGSVTLDQELIIQELTDEKLIWKLNGKKSELRAK